MPNYKDGVGNYKNTGGASTFVIKTSDQGIDTDTTVNDDDELLLVLSANRKYMIRLYLIVDTASNADFKATFKAITGTAYATFGAVASNLASSSPFGTTEAYAGGGEETILLIAFVETTTAGTLQFQWAQATSQASTTTVKTGSLLEVILIP